MWCTLAVSTKWVGYSSMTSVHFSQSVHSELWLLCVECNVLGLPNVAPNTDVTVNKAHTNWMGN